MSNFTLSLNGFNDGLDYTVVASMENVEPYTGTNLVLQFGVTESGCAYGGDIFNYVTRRLYPTQSGTPLDFSTNPNQSVTLQFTLDAGWVQENCEFVAFIQDNSTKEILQATKVGALDLMPLYFDNAGCVALNKVPVLNCTGEVAPRGNRHERWC
ncbi:MAG: hypothetical protein R2764_21150 [Bacteroidales bacterium]